MLQRALRQASAVSPSTLVMPHLLKSRASALRVLEETLPALWQLWYHSWIVEIVVKSPQYIPSKPWTLWKCLSWAGGSCTCTSSNSCPQLEHSPGSCCAALPGPRLLPPGNAKSQTWQFSPVTCIILAVLPMVIPLPLSPNKGPRQWEHPKELNPSWNMIQLPTLCEFQQQFKSFKKLLSPWAEGWDFVCCPLSKSGISKRTYFYLNFTQLTCILWTSKVELGMPPKACIKNPPTSGNSFLLCPLQAEAKWDVAWSMTAEGTSTSLAPPVHLPRGLTGATTPHLGASSCSPAPWQGTAITPL